MTRDEFDAAWAKARERFAAKNDDVPSSDDLQGNDDAFATVDDVKVVFKTQTGILLELMYDVLSELLVELD